MKTDFSWSSLLSVYWFIIIIPVMRELKVNYFLLWHPYAFVPTILFPIAIVLGWLGLKN